MGRGNNFVIAFFDSDSFLSKNYVGQKILILHIYCCQIWFCFSRHRIILWQWFSQSHKHSVWWMTKILLSNLSDPGLEKEVNWVSIPINVNMLPFFKGGKHLKIFWVYLPWEVPGIIFHNVGCEILLLMALVR